MNVVDVTVELQKYNVTDAAIAKMGAQYMALKVIDPEDEAGFKAVHEARMVVKGKRVEVEKTRVALKAEALEYGRKVDAEAKRITALLAPIEEHLTVQEKIVTDEKERRKREAEEKARQEKEAAERAIREAEEARIRAEREAEQKRLAEERAKLEAERAAMRAEQERIEAERRKEQAKRDAELRAERERLAAERAKVEAAQKAERERLAAIEAEQRKQREALEAEQRRMEMEKARAEAAEKARIAEQERIKREAEAEAKYKARIEAMKPDVEKIHILGVAISGITMPSMKSQTGKAFALKIMEGLGVLAQECRQFTAK